VAGAAPPCGNAPSQPIPNVPPRSRGEKTTRMSYLFGQQMRAELVEAHAGSPFDRLRAQSSRLRAQGRGLASSCQGLLEAQNAKNGGRHRLGARGEREPHGAASISLIEVGAWGERDTVLLEQRLTPRLGVRIWT
jgi:hypothetical protein